MGQQTGLAMLLRQSAAQAGARPSVALSEGSEAPPTPLHPHGLRSGGAGGSSFKLGHSAEGGAHIPAAALARGAHLVPCDTSRTSSTLCPLLRAIRAPRRRARCKRRALRRAC